MNEYGCDRVFLEKMKCNLKKIIEDNNGFKGREIIFFGYTAISIAAIDYLKTLGVLVNTIIDNNKMAYNFSHPDINAYNPKELLCPYDSKFVIMLGTQHNNIMKAQLEEYGYKLGREIYVYFDHKKELEMKAVCDKNILTIKERKEIQYNILSFLKEVTAFNNLNYYLMHGTLLGAVRHKGYIPWDDDLDVVMPVDDAYKLFDILKNNEQYEFYLPGLSDYYIGETPMLMDKSTFVYTMKFPLIIRQGVGIDIDLLFPCGNNIEENTDFINRYNEYENVLRASYMLDDYSHEIQKVLKEMMSFLTKFSLKEKKYVCGSYIYMEMIKYEDFGNGIDMDFEGDIFKVPKQYDSILRELYGDYMKLPPEKERNATRHVVYAYRR